MIQLGFLGAETVLGFCNCDDNKMWGFLFMIGSAATIVLSIAGASLAIDSESVGITVDDSLKKSDNVWYFYFALLSSPLPIRFLGIFLKFKDVTRGGE